MYKLYTGILNHFIEDHCITNKIITLEQAGGKKGSWGCTDQLLINKMIMDEVRKHKRSLFTMWFDYKKAFDSIPHVWLFEAMRLAKIPDRIIRAVQSLAEKWRTEIHMQTKESVSVTDLIRYLTGILQGDCLALLLFVLCVNPLSHLLNDCPGYMIGIPGARTTKITHLLFVDDLKTYSKNRSDALKQLEIITNFTNDIGMEFGADKCAYLNIEKGQRTPLTETISMNGLELQELEDGDSYKYLGQDKNIRYEGRLNKERITTEYYRRVRKIWSSELDAKNKITAHNTFAIPVLTPTFGILDWTKKEVEQMDVKTRKLFCLFGKFHLNSSPDSLYGLRKAVGSGMNSVIDIYITRLISLSVHIINVSDSSKYINEVKRHEEDKLRVANEIRESLGSEVNINGDDMEDPKKVSAAVKIQLKQNHTNRTTSMAQHGLVKRKQHDVEDYNEELTNSWLNEHNIPGHVEGYIFAIQEQEINTRALQKLREQKDNAQFDSKCRHCHHAKEDIFHILASCDHLSSSLYLPVRHDEVGKIIFNELVKEDVETTSYIVPKAGVAWNTETLEIWWDTHISTQPKTKHNKPDLVVWRKKKMQCTVIDICVPLDQNVKANEKVKKDRYLPLTVALKRLYPDYSYSVIPIVLGATGLVTKSLKKNLCDIGFDEKKTGRIIPKLQQKTLVGSMRVVKSALSLRK
jgi:hypothetical protein